MVVVVVISVVVAVAAEADHAAFQIPRAALQKLVVAQYSIGAIRGWFVAPHFASLVDQGLNFAEVLDVPFLNLVLKFALLIVPRRQFVLT